MVQAEQTGSFEDDGHLADDPADLVRRQGALGEQVGQGDAVPGLLDDISQPTIGPDVEDADQAGVLKRRGAACGVEHGGGLGQAGRKADEGDLPLEDGVRGAPSLGPAIDAQSSVGDIAPAEQRARAHTVHVSSPHVGFPPSYGADRALTRQRLLPLRSACGAGCGPDRRRRAPR